MARAPADGHSRLLRLADQYPGKLQIAGPGSSTDAIGQAERDRECQDLPGWQRHRLLTRETEERGGGMR